MLNIHKEIMEKGGYAVEIKPQTRTKEGEWVKNKDYKLKLLGGRIKKVVPTDGGEPFELVRYACDIILENGETRKGVYEISKTNKAGELNYQIKRMIDLEVGVEDIFTLRTDEKGFIDIQIVKKAEGKKEQATITDDDILDDDEEEINTADIPF